MTEQEKASRRTWTKGRGRAARPAPARATLQPTTRAILDTNHTSNRPTRPAPGRPDRESFPAPACPPGPCSRRRARPAEPAWTPPQPTGHPEQEPRPSQPTGPARTPPEIPLWPRWIHRHLTGLRLGAGRPGAHGGHGSRRAARRHSCLDTNRTPANRPGRRGHRRMFRSGLAGLRLGAGRPGAHGGRGWCRTARRHSPPDTPRTPADRPGQPEREPRLDRPRGSTVTTAHA
jgi:hypothetical protein